MRLSQYLPRKTKWQELNIAQKKSKIKLARSGQSCSDCAHQRKWSTNILPIACKNIVRSALQINQMWIFDRDRFFRLTICWLQNILNKKTKAQNRANARREICSIIYIHEKKTETSINCFFGTLNKAVLWLISILTLAEHIKVDEPFGSSPLLISKTSTWSVPPQQI